MKRVSVIPVAIALAGVVWGAGGFDRSDWLPQYPALVRWLSTLPDKSWGMSLGNDRSDPEERGTFTLSVEPGGSVLLTSRYKQQAIDRESGKVLSGIVIDVVMKIRDKNGDGVPDEFRGEPFHPDPGETITAGGFIVVRSQEHAAIIIQWDTMIGFAVHAMPSTLAAAPHPDGPVFAAYRKQAWWLPEYPKLSAMLDMGADKLTASYRTGPEGLSLVHLELQRGPSRGLTVVVDTPAPFVKALDEESGRLVPEDYRTVFTLRDTDLDGMPDQIRMAPAGKSPHEESFTDDGFMRIRDSVDHEDFLRMWTVTLGYCTNHFLHNKETAFP